MSTATPLSPMPMATPMLNDKGIIRLEWIQWLNQVAQLSFPVSSYYVTANSSVNPGTVLGFGQWAGVGYTLANATPIYIWTRTK